MSAAFSSAISVGFQGEAFVQLGASRVAQLAPRASEEATELVAQESRDRAVRSKAEPQFGPGEAVIPGGDRNAVREIEPLQEAVVGDAVVHREPVAALEPRRPLDGVFTGLQRPVRTQAVSGLLPAMPEDRTVTAV